MIAPPWGLSSMSQLLQAVGAALEATRPKTSGPSVNVHVVRSPRHVEPDFERMRREIAGDVKIDGVSRDEEPDC